MSFVINYTGKIHVNWVLCPSSSLYFENYQADLKRCNEQNHVKDYKKNFRKEVGAKRANWNQKTKSLELDI